MRENHSVTGALDCTAGPESSGGSIIFEGGDVERHRRRAVGIGYGEGVSRSLPGVGSDPSLENF